MRQEKGRRGEREGIETGEGEGREGGEGQRKKVRKEEGGDN